MTTFLTPEELLADLRVVAEKKQAELGHDYTYQRILGDPRGSGSITTTGGCYYEYKGAPSCIFGHLLANLYEVPLHKLSEEAEGNAAAVVLTGFGLTQFILDEDGHRNWSAAQNGRSVVQQIADEVQGLQDNGTSWVEAVTAVEKRYQAGEFS